MYELALGFRFSNRFTTLRIKENLICIIKVQAGFIIFSSFLYKTGRIYILDLMFCVFFNKL